MEQPQWPHWMAAEGELVAAPVGPLLIDAIVDRPRSDASLRLEVFRTPAASPRQAAHRYSWRRLPRRSSPSSSHPDTSRTSAGGRGNRCPTCAVKKLGFTLRGHSSYSWKVPTGDLCN